MNPYNFVYKHCNVVPSVSILLYLQILECVAVNLTLVYALLAYSEIKQKDFSSVYVC